MTIRLSIERSGLASERTRQATATDHVQESQHSETAKDSALTQLSDGEAQAFRHLAHSIVSRTLAHENEYNRMNCPEHDWELLKHQDDLTVYKRTSTKPSDQAKQPMVFCVGSMPGNLEDVLYGAHAKTRDEMQLKLPHQSRGNLDCAVVAKLEGSSSDDPYRQLSLKWQLTKTLGDVQFVNHRDLCTLESMGIGTDGQGERYAYHLTKSVNYAGCPPPGKHSGTIRANIMFCCIYRQAPGSDTVSVYVKGMFDLGGDPDPSLVIDTSCSVMLSTLKSAESAEAKRLTLLTLQNAESSASSSDGDLSAVDHKELNVGEESMTMRLSSSAFSILEEVSSASSTLTPAIVRLLSKTKRKSQPRRQQPTDPCCVCSKKPAKLSCFVGTTQRTCDVCLRGVCNKCHVRRRLLTRQQPVTITCCKSCLLKAKQLTVDPQDPCPVIL